MFDYWLERHRGAIAKADEARSSRLRQTYLDLADHYLTVYQDLIDHPTGPAGKQEPAATMSLRGPGIST